MNIFEGMTLKIYRCVVCDDLGNTFPSAREPIYKQTFGT